MSKRDKRLSLLGGQFDEDIELFQSEWRDEFWLKLRTVLSQKGINSGNLQNDLAMLAVDFLTEHVKGFKLVAPAKTRGAPQTISEQDWLELFTFIKEKTAAGLTVNAACRAASKALTRFSGRNHSSIASQFRLKRRAIHSRQSKMDLETRIVFALMGQGEAAALNKLSDQIDANIKRRKSRE